MPRRPQSELVWIGQSVRRRPARRTRRRPPQEPRARSPGESPPSRLQRLFMPSRPRCVTRAGSRSWSVRCAPPSSCRKRRPFGARALPRRPAPRVRRPGLFRLEPPLDPRARLSHGGTNPRNRELLVPILVARRTLHRVLRRRKAQEDRGVRRTSAGDLRRARGPGRKLEPGWRHRLRESRRRAAASRFGLRRRADAADDARSGPGRDEPSLALSSCRTAATSSISSRTSLLREIFPGMGIYVRALDSSEERLVSPARSSMAYSPRRPAGRMAPCSFSTTAT